jgi:hypothetical protein
MYTWCMWCKTLCVPNLTGNDSELEWAHTTHRGTHTTHRGTGSQRRQRLSDERWTKADGLHVILMPYDSTT